MNMFTADKKLNPEVRETLDRFLAVGWTIELEPSQIWTEPATVRIVTKEEPSRLHRETILLSLQKTLDFPFNLLFCARERPRVVAARGGPGIIFDEMPEQTSHTHAPFAGSKSREELIARAKAFKESK
jgi:hypothetical protein